MGKLIRANSIDDSYRAPAAQFFDAGDKTAVWKDIIAFRLHHYHEIALAFKEQVVEGVDGGISRNFERDANAQGLGQRNSGVFKRRDVVDRNLGVGAFFDAQAAADEHGNFELGPVLQGAIGLGENDQLD